MKRHEANPLEKHPFGTIRSVVSMERKGVRFVVAELAMDEGTVGHFKEDQGLVALYQVSSGSVTATVRVGEEEFETELGPGGSVRVAPDDSVRIECKAEASIIAVFWSDCGGGE